MSMSTRSAYLISVALCLSSILALVGASNSYRTQCSALSAVIGSKVFYPGNAVYKDSILSYFTAEQQGIAPSCIVRPSDSADVSLIIKTLSSLPGDPRHSPVAIRGGGHSTANSSNVNDGVTIDMRIMNDLKVSKDRKIVSVGSGGIWSDIYKQLDPMNLAVAGGRVEGIGAGGLTLGGGISYLSPKVGWACDGVENFEIVLANGSIVNANHESHSDLHRALRGGSNNFGVVTRFDLKAYSQGNFWGGFIFYPENTYVQHLSAFSNFMTSGLRDTSASIIMAFGFAAGFGRAVSISPVYSQPVVNPPVYQPFTAIQPQLSSTMRISNLTGLVLEEGTEQPVNDRGIYVSTVFDQTLPFLTDVYNKWNATVSTVSSAQNITYSMVFQRLPAILPNKNSLGLTEKDQRRVLCLFSISWANEADDALITNTVKTLIADIEAEAKTQGLFSPFKYLNYVGQFQDPISGYGEVSKANLQAVSRKYDPKGFFQERVSGGFKLF